MNPKRPSTLAELRIIGGQWRSRKLRFPELPGLRPTPDRVRETLFNWLSPVIEGASCLDLFAGSGALGLEALSRGAASCCFIDAAQSATEAIKAHLTTLKASPQTVIHHSGITWLNALNDSPRYHIAFVDPPFSQDLLAPALSALARPGILAEHAWVYVETAREEPLPPLPAYWTVHREKFAGHVGYRLLSVSSPHTPSPA